MGINRIVKRNFMKRKIKELMEKEEVSSGELKRGMGKMSLKERYKTFCGKAAK